MGDNNISRSQYFKYICNDCEILKYAKYSAKHMLEIIKFLILKMIISKFKMVEVQRGYSYNTYFIENQYLSMYYYTFISKCPETTFLTSNNKTSWRECIY